MTARIAPSMNIAIPFAAVGLGGGWLAGDFFHAGCYAHDGALRGLLLVLTPVAVGALGVLLSARAGQWPLWKAMTACVTGLFAAGVTFGFLIGVLTWQSHGGAMGAAHGLASSLVFLPPLAVILAAAYRVGRARPGSLIDASDRSAVWLAVATAVGAGTLAALPIWTLFPTCTTERSNGALLFGGAALAHIILAVAGDARRYARAIQACTDETRMRMRNPDASEPSATETAILDFGLGDLVTEDVVMGCAVYRDHPRPTRIVHGSPTEARRTLRWALALGILSLVSTSIAVGFQLFWPFRIPMACFAAP